MTDNRQSGVFMVFAEAVEPCKQMAQKLIDMVIDERDSWKAFAELPPIDGLTVLHLIAMIDSRSQKKANEAINRNNSARATHAANVRHEIDRKNKEWIRTEWLKGNFSTRPQCAEANYCHLDISYGTAYKYLLKTPDPCPWPAKEAEEKRKAAKGR